ncbi:hypothetical protein NliqN6_3539 [Naganishia liquefaciens]|uniref:Uncharacterized protein n=1 Tax=Naganishia liquefaciens TaxID=104408 RepID=A0A8H3TTZ9_9TREE|nr:hypothetical protein NliqN6_3539 [Naganishia liquefaciens]
MSAKSTSIATSIDIPDSLSPVERGQAIRQQRADSGRHDQPYQTRTATGSITSTTASKKRSLEDSEADPEFLALSKRQRRRVDTAFEKALRAVRKRRKVAEHAVAPASELGGGGFEVEDDEMGGGGFVAEEESGGGFMAEDDTTPATASTPHPSETADLLPYSALPDVFASLGLTWDDDVLATFKAISAASRGQEGADQSSWSLDDNYVDLKDFRSVIAVLMEPEEDKEGDVDDEDDDDGDVYAEDEEMQGDSSDLSEPENDDGSPVAKSRRKPGRRQKTKEAQEEALRIDQAGQRKLTREEKDWVGNMWETMFEGTTIGRGQRGENGRLLGKEQIKRWADQLGMAWTDQELTEMIELFSTQPGKRGLGFDDFCTLLVRGGML